jgi:hypothetical protein
VMVINLDTGKLVDYISMPFGSTHPKYFKRLKWYPTHVTGNDFGEEIVTFTCENEAALKHETSDNDVIRATFELGCGKHLVHDTRYYVFKKYNKVYIDSIYPTVDVSVHKSDVPISFHNQVYINKNEISQIQLYTGPTFEKAGLLDINLDIDVYTIQEMVTYKEYKYVKLKLPNKDNLYIRTHIHDVPIRGITIQ